jgi:hypothetical protein
MPLGKQITQVQVQFLTSATATVASVSSNIQVNNFDIEPIHEAIGDNPVHIKSENGTILPYKLNSRVKFSFDFDSTLQPKTMRELYNLFIDYSTIDRRIRIYPNTAGSAPATGDFVEVQLENAMSYRVKYTNTVGRLSPSIKLISKSLASSLPSSFSFTTATG